MPQTHSISRCYYKVCLLPGVLVIEVFFFLPESTPQAAGVAWGAGEWAFSSLATLGFFLGFSSGSTSSCNSSLLPPRVPCLCCSLPTHFLRVLPCAAFSVGFLQHCRSSKCELLRPTLNESLVNGCFWAGPHSLLLPFIANLGCTTSQGIM